MEHSHTHGGENGDEIYIAILGNGVSFSYKITSHQVLCCF